MRISEDRYANDLRRLNIAQRLIQHEVRTHWICAWTGFSRTRVRNLFRAYHRAQGQVQRHRGPSPTQVVWFLRSPLLRAEASAIGGLARVLGVVPLPKAAGARLDRLGVEGAERLCQVFEVFRRSAPDSRFTMDHLIALVTAVTRGEGFEIGHCSNCHGTLLLESLTDNHRTCPACREDSLAGRPESAGIPDREEGGSALPATGEPPESRQQSLF